MSRRAAIGSSHTWRGVFGRNARVAALCWFLGSQGSLLHCGRRAATWRDALPRCPPPTIECR
eukprot:4430085-Alexandrium_andersonii.AAC.1